MTRRTGRKHLVTLLDGLYERYQTRELVSPDPLQFLYRYDRLEDRELVGLVASSLAYGRVGTILSSVARVLALMGPRPRDFLDGVSRDDLTDGLSDFKHRFTTGSEVARLLLALRDELGHETIGRRLLRYHRGGTLVAAWDGFVEAIEGRIGMTSLVCRPARRSSCKRGFLFLRWMVRYDDVDPGGWNWFDPADLVVPLDTHMYQACRLLELTTRRSPDLAAALEATEGFRRLRPDDPVRYDFVLTRWGLRPDMAFEELVTMAGRRDDRRSDRS